MKRESVKSVLERYENIYVVTPVDSKNYIYLRLLEYLNCFCIEYKVLDKEFIGEKLSEKAICIFLNEDEKVGMQCLYGIEPCLRDVYGYDIREYEILADKQYQIKLTT